MGLVNRKKRTEFREIAAQIDQFQWQIKRKIERSRQLKDSSEIIAGLRAASSHLASARHEIDKIVVVIPE